MSNAVQRSCKGSPCIAYLEKLIDEIDPHPDLSRSGKFNRAIEKAKNIHTATDWEKLSRQLKKFKTSLPEGIVAPTALQVKVADGLVGELENIENEMMHSLGLNRLQTRLEFEILWFNYLEMLKIDVLSVGETNEEESIDMNGPEMVKRLVQILLLNRESDKEVIEKVKSALMEWRA